MTVDELIAIADKGYPEGLVLRAHQELKRPNPRLNTIGDSLAIFVAREISETYDEAKTDREQLQEAQSAINDLERVDDAIYDAKAKIKEPGDD